MSMNAIHRLPSPPRSNRPAAEIVVVAAMVFGPDLVLTTLYDGRMVLHHVSPAGRLRELGTFADPGHAWAAVDELELSGELALAA
jgi:hypothetical protein